jgi:hypothetical protein
LKIDCIKSVRVNIKKRKKKRKRKDLPLHTLENTAMIYTRFMGHFLKRKIKWEASLFILRSIRVNVHTYCEQFNPSVGIKCPTHVRPIRIYTVSIIGTIASARFLAFVNI